MKISDVVTKTMAEATSDEPMPKARALERLADWQKRVGQLYREIESNLPDDLVATREGKTHNYEDPAREAGLSSDEVPRLDVLRIARRSDESFVAILRPRHLWIIGANGRLDLEVAHGTRRLGYYIIIDRSAPLSGPADWNFAPLSNRSALRPFNAKALVQILGV